jgi:hypothetical protein
MRAPASEPSANETLVAGRLSELVTGTIQKDAVERAFLSWAESGGEAAQRSIAKAGGRPVRVWNAVPLGPRHKLQTLATLEPNPDGADSTETEMNMLRGAIGPLVVDIGEGKFG